MAHVAVLPGKASRGLALTLVWAIIGLAVLGASAAALYLSTRNDLLTAYNASPTCATFADALAGKNCRYTTTAKVSQVTSYGGSVVVDFDVPGQYTPYFTATLPVSDTSLRDGDPVQVELWQSRQRPAPGQPARDWVRRQIRGTQGQAANGAGMGPVAVSDALWR